jgi:hypothetical protein
LFKTTLFSSKDYKKQNRKTRPNPKRDPNVNKGKQNFVDQKKCRLCKELSIRSIKEGLETFNLCREHFEQYERKKMKFKAFFDKASNL